MRDVIYALCVVSAYSERKRVAVRSDERSRDREVVVRLDITREAGLTWLSCRRRGEEVEGV